MKIITLIALLSTACCLTAADKSAAHTDPLAGAFFPPEVVLMAGDQIALTQDQREAFRAHVEKTQPRSNELAERLTRETAALSTLARQERVDEAALIAQLDKVLDAERDLKHLHIGLLAWIKNFLTPEQQAKLKEITKDGGAPFVEATRQRLTEKVERVEASVQKWAASGHDPAVIAKRMEEKFKPLIEAGKPNEAEAELDRILEQLNKDTK
jgi:Spy/CpxP family protein refolding chaperone